MTQDTGPRSPVIDHEPDRPGNGSTRTWSRVLRGVPHGFTAVTMPDGERRYFASRYNGYGDDGTDAGRESGMRYGCAWSRVGAWIVAAPQPADVARSLPVYASGSPDPEAMRAAGFRPVMVDAADVRVDDVRVSGGIVTEVRAAKSGLTIWIGATGIGSERIRATSRITLWRR